MQLLDIQLPPMIDKFEASDKYIKIFLEIFSLENIC